MCGVNSDGPDVVSMGLEGVDLLKCVVVEDAY